MFARGSIDARTREETVIRTLRELQVDGRIDRIDVTTWPDEVSLLSEARSETLDTFEAFEAWAVDHGMGIRPPFDIRERRSTITNETDTLLVTPAVCMAVYDAEELIGVFPCSHGGSVTTIDDCLERLTRDDWSMAPPGGRESNGDRGRETGSDRRPGSTDGVDG